MNKINQSNEHSRLASPFVSEEVKNVIKNTTKQANAINNISNYVTTQQQKENQSKFDIPLLRAPHEQERNEKRINIQDDPQYKMTTFSLENDEDNTKPSLAEEEPKNNKKKDDHLDVSAQQNSSLPTSGPDHLENKKSNKDYDFLFLQLSYQHVIHEDILNKIKDPEKFDYYRDKLQKLSNGIDDLKELFKSGFNELDKTKGAFVDYWMEVYSQIKKRISKKSLKLKVF
ncbi:hypothetical protein [Proteus mirabilis]|uniref:hypothetical protein n=1 Tax=Proteus mirabilis TaxID=584 RepID=UPI001F5B5D23|nr:hypothetical protein [Proteus mirabilis]